MLPDFRLVQLGSSEYSLREPPDLSQFEQRRLQQSPKPPLPLGRVVTKLFAEDELLAIEPDAGWIDGDYYA